MAEWIDLLDPGEEELEKVLPPQIHERALEQLLEPATHDDEPRPRLEGHDRYVFGVFLLPVAVREEDRVVDQVAEDFLDLVDALNDEIDELEEGIETWTSTQVRGRISELRHDLLHVRRTLAPTRDAVRSIVDRRIDVGEGPEVLPRDVELNFADAYDKLLRATDGLDLSRDLLASARDYSKAKI